MDPLADMLTRIRNAQAVNKPLVLIPYSKIKFELAKLLEREGLIEGLDKWGRKAKRMIRINLKYDSEGRPVIFGLKRVSRPGQRVYLKKKDLRPVRQGHGFMVLSTSQGLMTNKEAKKQGLGGEAICQVWY